ncbi:hypothetical protein BASA83_009476 [Batrachochytrium salamandrivorans]|nr:hypothetical protein BASA83_009476 [Batrachochytrium salamandrivorans]
MELGKTSVDSSTSSSWFSNYNRSVQHRPKDDCDSRYSSDRKRPGLADLDWNDSALRVQFYFGLSYEIKDALVHFDTPSTLSLAIQQAIKVDNRLYERRLERTERRPPPPSPMVVPPPRSSNDMDIDFARRGPLTSEERQQRMSRGLCLVCGQSGHLKANCPKSNPNFRAPKSIRAIQIDDVDFENPGNDPGCL